MAEGEISIKSNKPSSLPVSIPIHVYRNTLKNICISSTKTTNMNTNKPAKPQRDTIKQVNVSDMITNLITERSAPKRPNPENSSAEKNVPERRTLGKPAPERETLGRPAPKRLVPDKPVLGRPAPDKPVLERPEIPLTGRQVPRRPAPEPQEFVRPASERPAPERPAPERPVPESPAPERSDREEYERIPRIRIQCCNHVCSSRNQNWLYAAMSMILSAVENFVHDKMGVFSDKSTQTDNTNMIGDFGETLKASNPVLKDISTFNNQFKQFFAQLGTMCQVLFSVKMKDNKEVFVFSGKKRQQFLGIVKNVIDTICSDGSDIQAPSNTVGVDEFGIADITASKNKTDSTGPLKSSEVVRQDNQQNQRQEESVNSLRVATSDNVGTTTRGTIGVGEQSVTIPIVQENLREQEIREPIIMKDTVNQSMPPNNEINIDHTTFNPQIMVNTERSCFTPRTQALQQQQYYQNQNYRNYHSKMFRTPYRGTSRPSQYPQQRPPIRNTEIPQALNTAQSQSAQMYYLYNQPQLQQQYVQQYCQRNPDAWQNDFSNSNQY